MSKENEKKIKCSKCKKLVLKDDLYCEVLCDACYHKELDILAERFNTALYEGSGLPKKYWVQK